MAWQGVDIRQTGERLMFRSLLQDSSGAIVTSGTTSLRLYEIQSDGTLKSYDFSDNTFKTGALTTNTLAMTHRQGNNATYNTGIWTVALATLTGFTSGGIYLAHVSNSGASPVVQVREFQFGGGQGANLIQIVGDAQSATDLKDFADDGYDPATHKIESVKVADNMRGTDGVPTNPMLDTEDGSSFDSIPDMATATNQAAIAGYIDTEVAAILAGLTSGIVVLHADYNAAKTAATQTSVDAKPTLAQILAGGDVDGFTIEETLKLCLAALAGILSGAGGTTITIRSADDSADRIVATVDIDGNRTAITLDATG